MNIMKLLKAAAGCCLLATLTIQAAEKTPMNGFFLIAITVLKVTADACFYE